MKNTKPKNTTIHETYRRTRITRITIYVEQPNLKRRHADDKLYVHGWFRKLDWSRVQLDPFLEFTLLSNHFNNPHPHQNAYNVTLAASCTNNKYFEESILLE
jgi:hypothetical protein